jgi:hypothetical protein
MALDRHTKLELLVRTTFRKLISDTYATAKQKPLVVPGFDIPRGGSVDLIVPPKSGTIMGLVQRSDYVGAYKHTVGQLIGILVHYHEMSERDLREGLRAAQSHPDIEELQQGTIDPLKVSKRLVEDRREGNITLALVTELPEVPQQARELEANFFPIAALLQTWIPVPVKKKKLCSQVEFYAVDANATPPKIAPLPEALAHLLKMGS